MSDLAEEIWKDFCERLAYILSDPGWSKVLAPEDERSYELALTESWDGKRDIASLCNGERSAFQGCPWVPKMVSWVFTWPDCIIWEAGKECEESENPFGEAPEDSGSKWKYCWPSLVLVHIVPLWFPWVGSVWRNEIPGFPGTYGVTFGKPLHDLG